MRPPGVGKFIYDDPIVVDPGDEELVVQGHIQINFLGDVDDIPFNRVEDCPVEPLPCE